MEGSVVIKSQLAESFLSLITQNSSEEPRPPPRMSGPPRDWNSKLLPPFFPQSLRSWEDLHTPPTHTHKEKKIKNIRELAEPPQTERIWCPHSQEVIRQLITKSMWVY